MNNYIIKNYSFNKDDIKSATNNIIKILEKKNKAIIAHDGGKRRNAILGNTIKYMLNTAKKRGVAKPVILGIRYRHMESKRAGSIRFLNNLRFSYGQNFDIQINPGEEIVGIVVEDFERIAEDIIESTPLIKFIDYVKVHNNIMYELLVTSDLFSSPVLLPFVAFRVIDNKFSKIIGLEGNSRLSTFFYDTLSGDTMPKKTGFIIHKKIVEYADTDLYNYVNKNDLIKPIVFRHATPKNEVLSVLKHIKEIDKEDGIEKTSYKKRFHIIICDYVKKFLDNYKPLLIDFALNKHKYVGKIIACQSISFPDKWDITKEYETKDRSKNTVIFIAPKHNFMCGPWHVANDIIKSVSFLSATGNKDHFPMSLRELMNMYKLLYTSNDAEQKNKIFVHCRGNYITYDNYVEMKYLLNVNLPYEFDEEILKALFDNYLSLGSLKTRVSRTIFAKKSA